MRSAISALSSSVSSLGEVDFDLRETSFLGHSKQIDVILIGSDSFWLVVTFVSTHSSGFATAYRLSFVRTVESVVSTEAVSLLRPNTIIVSCSSVETPEKERD